MRMSMRSTPTKNGRQGSRRLIGWPGPGRLHGDFYALVSNAIIIKVSTRRRKVRLLESLDAWRLSSRRHSIYY